MRRLIVLLLVTATPALAADIDIVRANFIGYYTAAGADRSSSRMQEALGALENTARAYTAPGFLLSDGSWSDINYKETPSGSWSPWAHVQRLTIMAKAYRTPGQAYYQNAQLLAQINASLAYVNTFYGTTILPLGNWWFWTMGVPLDLGPTLVLMRGDVDPATYDSLVRAIQLRIGNSPTARGISGPVPVGENLVWSCHTHLELALLKDDATMLAAVRDAMANVTMPTATGEGIKPDSSFHQHGAQLYTGGYGGSFADDVAKYALIARGTSFELPAASLAAFSDYVADGIAWSLYGNYFDVSVIGREVARPTTSGYHGVAALVQAAQFPSPRQGEIRAAAARTLQSWHATFPVELAGAAVLTEQLSAVSAAPWGHRHYFNSDYTIHRRDGWFASIKMFSTRTKSGESTNNENLFGSRQSDGRLYLSLDGNEYFAGNAFPALDWTRLPGTTVEQSPTAASATYGFGTRTYAGGTGDGRNGVSAMELAPLGSSLTAKKAFFFFDDAILFLGNSITSPSTNRVETIINQWPLRNATSPLVSGSDWAACENIGYWLPAPIALKTKREQRTGTWAALGGSTDSTERSTSFLTIWIDHGTAPVNATAEYAIVPNISADAMRAWAAAQPLAIVANNATVSAARDRRTNALGIAFWTAGVVEGFQSSAPALVYVTDDGRTMHVWAADPNAGAMGTFRLTIPGHFIGGGLRSTTLDIPRNGGRTTHVVLTRMVKRRGV